jgi:2-beta-glucuronyltransferase
LKNVLIVTGQHFATSPRKVDLHFIADALTAGGNRVDFLSLRLSWLSRLLHDGRWAFARTRQRNRWVEISPLSDEFIWCNIVHPMNFKLSPANTLSAPIFRHYGSILPRDVRSRLKTYSHILVESGPAPLLAATFRSLAPQATIIYHAADRLKTIGVHPVVEDVFARDAASYDLAHVMADSLRADIPRGIPIVFLTHGIAKDAFDASSESPYPPGSRNAVSVGDMLFDAAAIETMARANPDWTIHLFGRLARLDDGPANVVAHGEVDFATLVPYIKHADIGIAPYLDRRDANYLSESSLKMIQYTYSRLPIVAPAFAAAGRPHVLSYDPADAGSIRSAFETAKVYPRNTIDNTAVMSWREKTERLFAEPEREAAKRRFG